MMSWSSSGHRDNRDPSLESKKKGCSSICSGPTRAIRTRLHPRSGEKLQQSRQRMGFQWMSLAAVRRVRPPGTGTSVRSHTRLHLCSEVDYETLQRLAFRLLLSIWLVGQRRGFEQMSPDAVRLARPPGISVLSLLSSVAAKQLVRGDLTRDGLQGWLRA
jgi:hypothetical protein